MSTKTNFKRVALVAVASLGLGVLTSIAPANAANEITASDVAISAAGTTTPCKTGTPTASTTPRYHAVGASQGFVLTTNGNGGVSVTGNAKISSVGANSAIDGTFKYAALAHADLTVVPVVTFTGTGPVTVTFDNNTAGVISFYFIVTATCASGFSASTSYAQLNTSDTSVTSNVDVAAGATVQYSSTGLQKSYLNIDLNDAYGGVAALSTSAMIANVTGGCTLSYTSGASSGTLTAVSTGAAAANDSIVILNDNTPRSCVTTLTLDGAVVVTKTSKFFGDVATLTIDADSTHIFAYGQAGSASSTALNANGIVYYAKDSAGNTINLSAVPTISGGTAGFQQVSFADGS
jgi:hypothetical protein